MTNVNMKAGQITAKLRDAVPVHFYEDGAERIQYKNIDIPDSLKTLDIVDFGFNIAAEGKITFRLHFDNGILPVEFPPAREKMTRAEMAAAKAAKTEEAKTATSDTAAEAIAEGADEGEATAEPAAEDTVEPVDTSEVPAEEATPAIPETRFNVTGDQRKALVAAVKDFTNTDAVYKGAPSYAYAVGNYIIDRTGTLIGEPAPELLAALAEQGFTPEAA